MRCFALGLALAAVLFGQADASDGREDAWQGPAVFQVEYQVDLPPVPTGSSVRIWLPLAARSSDQDVIEEAIVSSWPVRTTTDGAGNRIAYVEGRGSLKEPLVVRSVVRRRPSSGTPRGAVAAGGVDDPARYGDAARLIPLAGMIREVADQTARGHDGGPEKARAFYDYVVENLRYDKSGHGWGQGSAIWACTKKRGNCTDFHSLFIGMSRSHGIPARFVMGLPVPDEPSGAIPGYHCWAEWWDDARGWVPVDSSEAKKRNQADAYFGRLPNDRVQYTVGRDLILEPPQASGPLNYFIYPHVEVDGHVLDDVQTTFSYERRPDESPLEQE